MTAMKSRFDLSLQFLRRNNLAGWFAWRPEELVMLSGYFPYWGLSFLLCLEDGETLLFLPELEPHDVIPEGVAVITYPWGNASCKDPFEVLCRQLEDELRKRKTAPELIGTLAESHRSSLPVMAAEHPPLAAQVLGNLTRRMASRPHLDRDFLKLFLYKTPGEVERIRLANRVAQTGLNAWHNTLTPGVTEAESAAATEAAVHALIGKHEVVSARSWAMVQSGPNTADAGSFNRSTGRRFRSGDLALIEMATCVNGYWSDLTRSLTVGQTGPEADRLLRAIAVAQQAAIGMVRPGVSAHDVDAAARRSLQEAGLADYFTHATGHHTGFRYHDVGFGIAPGNPDLLEAGMVLTIEPGAYLRARGMGARIEDNIAVTNECADILSAEQGATF